MQQHSGLLETLYIALIEASWRLEDCNMSYIISTRLPALTVAYTGQEQGAEVITLQYRRKQAVLWHWRWHWQWSGCDVEIKWSIWWAARERARSDLVSRDKTRPSFYRQLFRSRLHRLPAYYCSDHAMRV
jgi:hypothetical protein